MTYIPLIFVGGKSLSSDCCEAEALNTYFGSVFNPIFNFNIVQPESSEILLDVFSLTVSDVELLMPNYGDSLSIGLRNIPSFNIKH